MGWIETDRGGIRHIECGIDALPELIAGYRHAGDMERGSGMEPRGTL
jgi:hypothetical protein